MPLRALATFLLAAFLWCGTATAAPKALGFADLSNVTYSGRSLTTKLGEVADVRDFGAIPSDSADDCTGVQAAIATTKPVYFPAGIYNLACQLVLTTSGQYLFGDSRYQSELLFSYTAGPNIVIGGSAAQTHDVGVRSLYILGARGAVLFWTRWSRGFRIDDARINCDGLIILGDETLGTSKPSYIFEILGSSQVDQKLDPVFDLIVAKNFAGQYVAQDAQISCGGADNEATDYYGWNTAPNIQDRIDHFIVSGGYFSRCKVNYYFYNGRVVNGYVVNHHSEGGGAHAFQFEISSDTTKTMGQVGSEGFGIANSSLNSTDEAIYIKTAAPFGSGFNNMRFDGVRITGATGVKSPIRIEQSGSNGYVYDIEVIGLTGYITPTDANQDAVSIVGGTSQLLHHIAVQGVTVQGVTTALRSGVHVEGTGVRNIAVSTIEPANAGARVDDAADSGSGGRVRVDGRWPVLNLTKSFGSVSSGSVGTTTSTTLVTTVKAGDVVTVVPQANPPAGVSYTGRITSDGVLDLYAPNISGSSQTLNSIGLDVYVTPKG